MQLFVCLFVVCFFTCLSDRCFPFVLFVVVVDVMQKKMNDAIDPKHARAYTHTKNERARRHV